MFIIIINIGMSSKLKTRWKKGEKIWKISKALLYLYFSTVVLRRVDWDCSILFTVWAWPFYDQWLMWINKQSILIMQLSTGWTVCLAHSCWTTIRLVSFLFYIYASYWQKGLFINYFILFLALSDPLPVIFWIPPSPHTGWHNLWTTFIIQIFFIK